MTTETATTDQNCRRSGEEGMTLLAVMAIMVVFAIGLLAVAPSVQQEVQREKEIEAIHRGEEVAAAIRQYVEFYKKLPENLDDLLEGLPQGTKKRMILRESAAIDPLSSDGKWRLVKPDPQTLARFARRVQNYNNGLLPSNPAPRQLWDRYAVVIVNEINKIDEDDANADPDDDVDDVTSNTPFIGVASQDRGKSVITYYGIENHSKWVFTPLFRGEGNFNIRPQRQPTRGGNNADF